MAKVGCDVYRFGPHQLDSAGQRLLRGADPVPLLGRHLRILLVLVSNAGHIVPKEALIEAAWADVAVTDNSLERAVSDIRKTLGVQAEKCSTVRTVGTSVSATSSATSGWASRLDFKNWCLSVMSKI